jgi:hypothetical protein
MTIPPIPDTLSKFCFLIGFIAIGYGYLQFESASKEYKEISSRYIFRLDSINNSVSKELSKISNLETIFNTLRSRHDSIHAQLRRDSLASNSYINKVKLAVPNLRRLIDSMTLVNNQSKDILSAIDKKDVPQILSTEYQTSLKNLNYARNTNTIASIVGFLLLVTGLIELYKVQNLQNELLTRQLGEKEKYYIFCQSCGKNFSSAQFHGKNSDGSKNNSFCFECYENGQFKESNITIEDIRSRMINDIKDGSSKLSKSQLMSRLKELERWSKSKYS